MTDTSVQTTATPTCEGCGASVKSYWNACPACHAPLSVRPVGSYSPSGQAEPAPVSAPTPGRLPDEPASLPTVAPPSWRGDVAPNGYSSPAAASAPPPAAYPPPSADGSTAPNVAPDWAANPYAVGVPSYYPAPPVVAPSRSGPPWMAIVIALVVLVLATGGFAAYSASRLTSTRTDLHQAQATLRTTQTALGNAQATVSDQADEIASYRTCLSDLFSLGVDIRGNDISAAQTADIQAEKDCQSLGLG